MNPEVIKDAIIAIKKIDEENEQKSRKLVYYFDELEITYEKYHILREPYKYLELGDFYLNLEYLEKSSYFLHIANFILLESPQTEKNQTTSNFISEQLKIIELDKHKIERIKEKAYEKALAILKQEEDQNIKEYLKNLNRMLSTIYDEIYQIKTEEIKKEEIIKGITDSLKFLKAKIDLNIEQNNNHSLDRFLMNDNLLRLDDLSKNLTDHVNSIHEKYEIQIDERTKGEIIDAIEKPLNDFESKTDKVIKTFDSVNSIIGYAEKQLSFIKQEGIKDFAAIKSDVQEHLTAFKQQEARLSSYKNEVLEYLKASEQRMIKRIEQLHFNDPAKNEAIQTIQKSIEQLENILLKTLKTDSRIQNYNNFSTNNHIETVLTACRNLESSVITQTNEILNYSKDIESIKNQQNALENFLESQTAQALSGFTQNQETLKTIKTNQYRVEHSLLTHTKHALNNYQNIIDYQAAKPPLSKSQKVFLVVYFIVMLASALYFISRYGLLDLILNLWHTAWQRFNL